MSPRSPAQAIAWELWSRGRLRLLAIVALLAGGAGTTSMVRRQTEPFAGAEPMAWSLTVLTLLLTFGCFHFTEGRRKGGFGGFPIRMFVLPIRTRWLVALPMLYAAAAVLLVYAVCARCLFAPLGRDLPLLWPSLYLVCGIAHFQMILWSLPESRYLKLLCLSLAGCLIAFAWMFFLPDIIPGTLEDWGYTGDPARFMNGFLTLLALTGPSAYLVTLSRVHAQRHGRTSGARPLARWLDRTLDPWVRRRSPFRSVHQALLWHEWRRTGWILPICTGVVLAITCVPATLAEALSARATFGILTWLFVAPFLFAAIIGRGFAKPDFWSPDFKMSPFHAVRPAAPGQWVMAKLKTAFWSAALTWALVLFLGFVWTAHVGDPGDLHMWWIRVRFFYTPTERLLASILFLPAIVVVTWRLLISGLALGLSNRPRWQLASNILLATLLAGLFAATIWRSDTDNHPFQPHNFWPWIEQLPWILPAAIILKLGLATHAWSQAHERNLVSTGAMVRCLIAWLLATTLLAALALVSSGHTEWLRYLLLLAAPLIPPLAGPPLAILALARNRSTP